MSTSSTTLHEPSESLQPEMIDRHRAIVSLMEEFEAIDGYDQRVDATPDEDLKAILVHNRDEEKEHAIMTLEWLRRKDPVLDRQMRTYLFAEGDILAAEVAATARESNAASDVPVGDGSLGIGSLKEKENRQ